MEDLETRISGAVEYYWRKLSDQAGAQEESEDVPGGRRAEVIGGKQMDGFAALCDELLLEAGIPKESIRHEHDATLPGYFRATKRWDLAVIHDKELLAVVEFKSITSSFGNNLNNRIEEALGNPLDLYTAHEEGAYESSSEPWLGYLLLMAENENSTSSVGIREPVYEVFEKYETASYVERGEQLCLRLSNRDLYNATAFILSDQEAGRHGGYSEPNPDLTFEGFVSSLLDYVSDHIGVEQRRFDDY